MELKEEEEAEKGRGAWPEPHHRCVGGKGMPAEVMELNLLPVVFSL